MNCSLEIKGSFQFQISWVHDFVPFKWKFNGNIVVINSLSVGLLIFILWQYM